MTEILVAVGLALMLSLGINRVMLVLAPRFGLMDEPGERRIHSTPIPRAGGIAIWLSFLLVIAGVLAMDRVNPAGYLSWQWLAAFGAGSLVLMVAGFIDDRSGLRPLVKLGAHALAPAVFFLIYPVRTGLFPAHWHFIFDLLAFMVWVVLLINAFNLIDGLDGLCGGLSAVACVALSVLATINDRMDSALLLLVMAGAIAGFLKYNVNPARIFLGDAGSMLLGFFLATAATEAVGRKAVVGAILLPIAVAGVPLLDVLLAIWRRAARRLVRQLRGETAAGGIFDADSDHLHHRLLESGNSQRKVATVLHGIAIVLAVLGFLPLMFGDRVYGLSLLGFMIVGMVGLRNLARVEIEQTSSAVHMAIKLPTHRRMAFVLFFYDLLALTAAGIAAATIESNAFVRDTPVGEFIHFTVLFVILGSLATLVAKIHLRLWVRATLRSILSLQFWLGVAAVATFSLFSFAYASLGWSALRLAMMAYVFACIGICLPRVALDLLREMGLDARSRNPKQACPKGYGPVVILGAGDLGTLLLDHLKSSAHDRYADMRVLGFIDETKMLHGRRLRSFRILGDLSTVPKLVEDEGLMGIILAIENPRRELVEQLEELSLAYGLRIHRWNVGLTEELPNGLRLVDVAGLHEKIKVPKFRWNAAPLPAEHPAGSA